METVNGYWQDENGNRWNANEYTESQAKNARLVSCTGCVDCFSCSDCSRCSRCSDCSGCTYCTCCTYCSYCSDCSRCSDCSDCSRCLDFDTQPQQYSTPKMGRVNRINFLHWTPEKSSVTCGCFTGSIDKLERRVAEVHGDNKHGKDYRDQIAIFRMLVEASKREEQG